MTKKLNIEEVENFVKSKGCKLISTEYVNNRTKLNFQCTCGEFFEKQFDSFQKSPQCKKCGYKINAQKQSYTYEQVYNIFLESGCLLLEPFYKNGKQKMKYICECGNQSYTILGSFLNGSRCNECGIIKRTNANKLSYDYVKNTFEERGCVLLSKEYINNRTPLYYICNCGNENWIAFSDFSGGHDCRICANKKLSDFHRNVMVYSKGENHHAWDFTKTQEEREKNRWLSEQKVWRKQIYERDNYICQCCGDNKGGNLIAHHLDGYDWCKVSRWNIDNGITLCKICHNDFHQIYGFGLNTKEQFEEYMEGISWNCVGIYNNSKVI